MRAGFGVSYAQTNPSVVHSLLPTQLAWYSQVIFQLIEESRIAHPKKKNTSKGFIILDTMQPIEKGNRQR